MNIIADENMPALSLFDGIGTVVRTPGRPLDRTLLADADVLLVRSVTRVDAELLAGSAVRFVGSATIGTDHIDQAPLAAAGITFAHAPGCNAVAVAEYVLQAVVAFAVQRRTPLSALSLGVVGVGNVGRKVVQWAAAFGLRVLASDPPREAAGEACEEGAEWAPLAEVLACSVITLHVPLSVTGMAPTRHLIAADQLALLSAGQLLINTSRGPVIAEQALRERLDQPQPPQCILDVWEHEPWVTPQLLAQVQIGTPHIAGYSVEGKVRGTYMLYQALRQWRGLTDAAKPMPLDAPPRHWEAPLETEAQLLALLQWVYPMARDHQALVSACGAGPNETPPSREVAAVRFDQLRKRYPLRYELGGLRVSGAVAPAWAQALSLLGVQC